MSHKTAVEAILTQFKTGWSTPIAYDNVNFTKPNPPAQWVRISVQPNFAEAADVGANLERHSGNVFIQCFTPDNAGPYDPATLAGDAAGQLRFKRLARTGERDVRTYAAAINRIGNTDDGWFQVNVTIPFEYDEAT